MASIEHLEKLKTSYATIIALIIGIVALSFVTGAVFSYLASIIPLCVILAIIGFAGCGLSYYYYTKIQRNKTAQILPLIDGQYDIVYKACEQANSLLS